MKMSHLSNGVSRNQKRKARRLIQCAMVGAAVSLALYPGVSRADVNLSPYDGYDITQHADGGFPSPAGGYGDNNPGNSNWPPNTYVDYPDSYFTDQGIPLITVDTRTDDPNDNTTTSLRDALQQASASPNGAVIYFSNESVPITLDYANGPLVVSPGTTIYFHSHNFRMGEESGTGWPAGTNPLLKVAGKVVFFGTYNSPAYAEYPIEIDDGGEVDVYIPHVSGYSYGKVPETNILDIYGDGIFKENRYGRINNNFPNNPIKLHDTSTFEVGQQNTINSEMDLYDNSHFISNGGNTFFYFGHAGDGSQNVLTKDLNLYDSSNAVLGYKTTLNQNLNVGNLTPPVGDILAQTPTVRLLGPSTVNQNATFGSGSTIVASLNTPLTDASDNSYDNPSSEYPNKVPFYSGAAYDPNAIGNVRALLTVNGQLTVDDGSKLVIDSVNSNSLHVGDKYLVFTSANQSGLLNLNNNISTSLTPLTFSDLTQDSLNLNNYYVEVTGINFANSFDNATGGNKEQRSFFKYIRDIAPDNNLPGNVNATLLYLYNNLGSGPGYNYNIANSFLGDTYTAHAAQLYWNQQAFLNEITDHLGSKRDMNLGESTFSLAGGGLNNVQGQLSTLNRSLNTPSLGLASVLNANGNNGTGNSGVWADAYGGRVNTKDDNALGTPSWDGDTTGFAAGYTGGSEHFNYGVAVGHQKSNLSFNDRAASGDLEGYNAGLYASLNRKKSYLNGILSYSHFDNDASRTDGIGGDSSSFNSHGLAAKVEYGIRVHQTKTSDFTPYASLAWTKSERGSITENGTGAGLTLDSNSNSIETTQLGVRYNHRTFDKSGSLKGGIQAGVAWVHQFGDTDFPTTAHFTGAPGSFDIYNTPLSSNAAQVQLGAYGRIHNNVIGFVNYQGTFGGNEHVNSVTGGLGYQF